MAPVSTTFPILDDRAGARNNLRNFLGVEKIFVRAKASKNFVKNFEKLRASIFFLAFFATHGTCSSFQRHDVERYFDLLPV